MDNLFIAFPLYVLSGALLVFFSIKCGDYVDLLDKKTNMSGAFIGGVILAAVTSLPELVTSISSIYVVDNPELIMGNVLGSNIFNLCIFGGTTALSVKAFANAKVGKAHLATIICTIVADILMLATLIIGYQNTRIPVIHINAASLVILVIYFVSLRFLSNDDCENDEEDTCALTVKQIVIRFILMSLGLVAMSIVVTYFTDIIAEKLNLGASLAGAIFLGVVTSLPELTSSIALVRKRNFNAMIGNVVGSNMFNFTIFSIADFIAGTTPVYKVADEAAPKNMIYFGILSTVLVAASILLQSKFKNKNPQHKGKLVIYVLLGLGVVASYLTAMIL
ncbi:MAG: sodium:calcium antiporter [Clostridia bacterium]|nr:sodium:calcium antiporter [Clostridia bacterium]